MRSLVRARSRGDAHVAELPTTWVLGALSTLPNGSAMPGDNPLLSTRLHGLPLSCRDSPPVKEKRELFQTAPRGAPLSQPFGFSDMPDDHRYANV